jgi:ring-1,2-phenylacetyl-CoA epoxidase subunit PaaD
MSASVDDVMEVLREIPDPEMPISIVDLGLIEHVKVEPGTAGARVDITVLPTFVGCPALPVIERDIIDRVAAMEGVGAVGVVFVNDPPWTVDRISPDGRAALREHGVTVPKRGAATEITALRTSAVPCPFCASRATRLDSPFGPTRCRMIYYCEACRNTFEHMKRV